MDQLKIVIEWIKKHHFWVLCGAVLAIGLAIWFSSTSTLAKSYKDEKGKITGATTSVQKIFVESTHPTDDTIEAVEREREALKEEVRKAWESLLENQEEYTKWPGELGREFVQDVEKLDPDDPIRTKHREKYQAVIPEYVRKLLIERVDVLRPKFEGSGQGVPGPGRGLIGEMPGYASEGPTYLGEGPGPGYAESTGSRKQEEELTGIVRWGEIGETDSRRVGSSESGPGGSVVRGQTKRSAIVAKYEWESTPSTKEVRNAQEDIWVYENLLEVIRATNEAVGATGQHDAAVKAIDIFEIGEETGPAWQEAKVYLDIPTGAAPAAAGAGGGLPEGPGGPPTPMEGAPPMEGPPVEGMEMGVGPIDESGYMGGLGRREAGWRYVDAKGNPVISEDLHPFPQFRLMPFHLRVVVDQKRIPEFLVQIANAALPTEIAHFAINPDDYVSADFRSAVPTQPGSPYEMVPGGPTTRSRRSKSSLGMEGGIGAMSGSRQGQMASAFDGNVAFELLGYVYLFNPVDDQSLGGGEDQQEEDAGSSGEPAVRPGPGAPPAAPPTTPLATPASPPGTPSSPAGTPGSPVKVETKAPTAPPAAKASNEAGPSGKVASPAVAPPG